MVPARCILFAALASGLPAAWGLRVLVPKASAPVDDLKSLPDSLGGLSFQSEHMETEEEASTESEDRVLTGDEGTMPFKAVPPVEVFRHKWAAFAAHGLEGKTQNKPRWRMVVGIFSRLDKDKAYRDVIRATWMKQPLVCSIKEFRLKKRCKLYVTFVVAGKASFRDDGGLVGNASGAGGSGQTVILGTSMNETGNVSGGEDNGTEADLTVLNVPESINCGKTRAWFAYAATEYKQATYIAKMDMDAFVDVRRLNLVMQDWDALKKDSCQHVYGGRPWHCPYEAYCPPMGCGHPQGVDYWKYPSGNKQCWSYMQGGFYFMSSLMAHNVSEEGGWWHSQDKRCLPEDVIAGRAIASWGRTKERTRCMQVVNLLAQEVVWHPDWIGYWTPPFNKPE